MPVNGAWDPSRGKALDAPSRNTAPYMFIPEEPSLWALTMLALPSEATSAICKAHGSEIHVLSAIFEVLQHYYYAELGEITSRAPIRGWDRSTASPSTVADNMSCSTSKSAVHVKFSVYLRSYMVSLKQLSSKFPIVAFATRTTVAKKMVQAQRARAIVVYEFHTPVLEIVERKSMSSKSMNLYDG